VIEEIRCLPMPRPRNSDSGVLPLALGRPGKGVTFPVLSKEHGNFRCLLSPGSVDPHNVVGKSVRLLAGSRDQLVKRADDPVRIVDE
jgi:hypothetical protein